MPTLILIASICILRWLMRIYDMRQKEVINICDGERIGQVDDILFNADTGCITDLIVPGPCKIWGMFGRENEYIIPFRCVRQVGTDVILVEIEIEKCLRKCEFL